MVFMKKNYIFFDLGYTLVQLKREEKLLKILKEYNVEIPLAELDKAFHVTDKLFMREYAGVLGKERDGYMHWYMGFLLNYLNKRLPILEISDKFFEAQFKIKDQWHVYDFAHKTLEELKQRSFGLGIISNWDPSAREVLEKNRLLDYFDNIVISSEVKYEKPDPRIFEIAFEEAGVSPGDCLYVGDNYYDDVIGSRNVGMDAVVINRFGRLGIEELDDCIVISDVSEVPALLQKGTDKMVG